MFIPNDMLELSVIMVLSYEWPLTNYNH